MLELKDLFENFDLAETALNLYDCNLEKSRKAFKYFRISSNAIYPFFEKNGFAFLRLSPVYSKTQESVIAEEEFLKYLLENDYPVPQIVPMKDGKEVTVISTEYGEYIVTAFYLVEGDSLEDYIEENGISTDIGFKYGEALGKLHNLSAKFKPSSKRYTLEQFLDTVEKDLSNYGDAKIFNRFKKDRKALESIEKTPTNFGLIHYDFELDNVFVDDGEIKVIDFDDSFYCYYELDYMRTINELNSFDENIKKAFKQGYESQRLPENVEHDELFDRIGKYQHYGELCRVLAGDVAQKPDWMLKVIEKLELMRAKRKEELLSDPYDC